MNNCQLCAGTGWLHGAQEWTPERMRKGTPYKSVRCDCQGCELPECEHRLCICGHAECSHADENVQPNCSDCQCNGFREASDRRKAPERGLTEDQQRVERWRVAMKRQFVNDEGVDWLCDRALNGPGEV